MASVDETKLEITDDALVNTVTSEDASLAVRRYFTIAGRDPFEEIEWETRDAFIPGKDKPAFEQKSVEFPKFWSQTATNIVAQKYFRGRMSSPERESSVKQMIGRVVRTIGAWGRDGGYFATEEEAETFEAELKAILVNQLASFNSPVWFNVGFEEKPQCSACFILSIDDSMESILDWIRREGIIFRGGSGSGVNLSKLRSSKEQLSKGGYASGPVSFMRGADASAGTIKSGGKTRRAAKMVVLDVDHPDIEEFIWCKAREEEKARVLEAAGYDMSLDSGDWASIQYQNANNSVRVSDSFMQAVDDDSDWNLTARNDGTVVDTMKARKLLHEIAEAAWRCADPGVQYDTTINSWHTLPNTGARIGVISKNRAAVGNIANAETVPSDLLGAARKAWDDALDLGEVHGYRNAQATVLAPTGTISFMMDCDTTGVEPDFSLVKSKKLVGGGEITIVNKTVPMALEKLGYAPREVQEVVAYIDERNTIVGAPSVKAEHYPVFDCAVGDRAIHYLGHVKMMGGVQPFISGAISKTVNLPEEATVEDVMSLYVDAWKLGVKAIAIYRDNCKVAQPLSSSKDATAPPRVLVRGRERRPLDRTEIGRKFQVGDHEGYIHVGLYDDGSPGDIFVDIAKDGTTMAGLMNSLCLAVSMGLQYGLPPEVYVSKLSHMRFEPSGLTNDADIRSAKSIVDYIFRWFGKRFLTPEQQEEAGILSPEVKARLAERYAAGEAAATADPVDAPPPGQTALFNSWEDAVECARCGGRMVRTGSCYTCRDCGTNTGCS